MQALERQPGHTLSIDLISEDFDSYLRVVGPGLSEALTDDDGCNELNSRLEVPFPQDGVYHVIVSSLSGATGTFTLRVRRDTTPGGRSSHGHHPARRR